MNTVDYITLKDNAIEARKAQLRVRRLYQENANHDLGALYAYLYRYVDAVGANPPVLSSVFLSPKTFETWLNDLDKWFFTVAALYDITLPEEE